MAFNVKPKNIQIKRNILHKTSILWHDEQALKIMYIIVYKYSNATNLN